MVPGCRPRAAPPTRRLERKMTRHQELNATGACWPQPTENTRREPAAVDRRSEHA